MGVGQNVHKTFTCAISSRKGTSRGLRGTGASRTGAGNTHGIVLCVAVQSDIAGELMLPQHGTLSGAQRFRSRRPTLRI